MNIVLFGAGPMANEFINFCRYNSQMKDVYIIFVCDNDETKHNKSICGYDIKSPDELGKYSDVDAIVVCSQYFQEIKTQIKDDLNNSVDVYSILEFKRFKTILYNKKLNDDRNTEKGLLKKDTNEEASIVVYTAILGDYDTLYTPLVPKNGITYICFTDNPNLKSDYWDIVYVDKPDNPRRQGKYYKILPHLFLRDYDISIWVDGNTIIKKDLRVFIHNYLKCSNLLFISHDLRICGYEEAAACLFYNLGEKNIIINQLNKYYNAGFPSEYGMYCGGFIVRKHNEKDVISMMNSWYGEVTKYSLRDQLSLGYCLWNSGIDYEVVDIDYTDNEWMQHPRHKLIK